jgi:ribosomal protein L11 methyltransferase
VLRLSVSSEPGAEHEERLRARVLEAFPAGVEEDRDAAGRLQLHAYGEPPLSLPGVGRWRVETVEPGWERRWRDHHRGRVVAERVWIGPPWETPPPGLLPVAIEPAQAFGTGSHPTTFLSAELLCGLEPGGPVLDLGSGSGVLSVVAARLGYAPVMACDLDPVGVAATAANAARNGVAVDVFAADATQDPLPVAPLWLANILLAPLVSVMARPDAPPRAIVSGLLSTQRFSPAGYAVIRRLEAAGWQALLLERT